MGTGLKSVPLAGTVPADFGKGVRKGDRMETDKFVEVTKKLEPKKKGEKEDLEKLQKLFERFHLNNRNYLDKETFEKAQASIPTIAETIVNTIQYLDSEIARLRSKRMKLPFENVELGEMQKVQKRNDMLLNDYLAESEK
jgi:hypothetical protein